MTNPQQLSMHALRGMRHLRHSSSHTCQFVDDLLAQNQDCTVHRCDGKGLDKIKSDTLWRARGTKISSPRLPLGVDVHYCCPCKRLEPLVELENFISSLGQTIIEQSCSARSGERSPDLILALPFIVESKERSGVILLSNDKKRALE